MVDVQVPEIPQEVDPEKEVQVQQQPISFINREPVAIMAVIRAGLALAIGFGFQLDPEQMAMIIVFAEALLGLFTRQQVTPFVSAGTTPNVQNPANTPRVHPAADNVVG